MRWGRGRISGRGQTLVSPFGSSQSLSILLSPSSLRADQAEPGKQKTPDKGSWGRLAGCGWKHQFSCPLAQALLCGDQQRFPSRCESLTRTTWGYWAHGVSAAATQRLPCPRFRSLAAARPLTNLLPPVLNSGLESAGAKPGRKKGQGLRPGRAAWRTTVTGCIRGKSQSDIKWVRLGEPCCLHPSPPAGHSSPPFPLGLSARG